jgi:23S rRNA pseudouridine1911/1915/1917 synthase
MIEPDFEILHEDRQILIVNKPHGLLTQAPEGIDNLEARIRRFLIAREEKPGGCYLGIPHRLDRPSTGVMIFAKNVRATQRISRQFEHRFTRKTYWALVEGHVEETDEGRWEDYMRKVKGEARSVICSPMHPQAREAVLRYKIVQRLTFPSGKEATWLEIELETGRTHQIRLQASSREHPVLGDAQYGSTMSFGPQFEDVRLRAIALHARSLSLEHPMTKEPISFEAPIGEAWREFGVSEEDLV